VIAKLKDGVERISTFQNKAYQGIQLCLGDSRKYKEKNICARLIDDFDAEKYCDRNCREPTWQCRKSAVTSLGRYSWLSAVFGIRSSLLENTPAG